MRNLKLKTFVVVCMAISYCAKAQTITHGPFIGAVTDNSARLFIRTSTATPITVLLSTDTAFISSLIFSGATVAGNDTGGVTNLTGLSANTKYYYRAATNGADTSAIQSFMTFPPSGTVSNFHFDFGSCQQFQGNPPINENILDKISADEPRFFLQCGDWGYPDDTDDWPTDSNFFSIEYKNVTDIYKERYSGQQMKNLMAKIPVDYVYDDHDYVNDNASRNSCSFYFGGQPLAEIPFDPMARKHSIDGYYNLFPHYNLPDTSEGIYHSFRYGNVEVFMCDNRSAKSPTLASLRLQGNSYVFDPPASGHTMLGQTQLQWLLNGLQNSTATWKFVVTGVLFNKGYRKAITALSGNDFIQNSITIPGYGSGVSLLAVMVDTWSGYPNEQDSILNFCTQNNIKNVIWLSSDSHTSAIDDGTNAGFPELMAGNLRKDNSRVAWFLDIANTFPTISQDLSAWNGGGQGLGNNNFEHAFGRVEIFGNDSVELSIVDVNGAEIASLIVCEAGLPCALTGIPVNRLPGNAFILHPNAATEQLSIKLNDKEIVDDNTNISVFEITGKKVMELPSALHISGTQTININALSKGMYFLVLQTAKGNFVKSFHKQ